MKLKIKVQYTAQNTTSTEPIKNQHLQGTQSRQLQLNSWIFTY